MNTSMLHLHCWISVNIWMAWTVLYKVGTSQILLQTCNCLILTEQTPLNIATHWNGLIYVRQISAILHFIDGSGIKNRAGVWGKPCRGAGGRQVLRVGAEGCGFWKWGVAVPRAVAGGAAILPKLGTPKQSPAELLLVPLPLPHASPTLAVALKATAAVIAGDCFGVLGMGMLPGHGLCRSGRWFCHSS